MRFQSSPSSLRPFLFPSLFLGLAGLTAGFVGAGCSSSSSSTPVVDAGPPPDDSTPVTCGPIPGLTVTPATGPKFCELPGTDAPELTVPDGFCVREFTTAPVAETRVLRFAPNGDLFVGAPSQGAPGGAAGGPGAIVVLADDNHDGKADMTLIYAGGGMGTVSACAAAEMNPADLSCVHGIAIVGSYLYYTRSDEVRRFPYVRGDRKSPTDAGELVASLNGAGLGARWTHTLDATADGHILVSRGRYEGNSCSDTEMQTGAVFSLDVSAPLPVTPVVLADGFRNPMYLRCRTACGDCFANELSGDGWSGIGGYEKLVPLKANDHWGYPCCVAKGMPAPGGDASQCGGLGTERVSIPLHDTPFGLDFETGRFPAPYTYGAFSALHGQVGSWSGTALSWVPTDPVTHLPTGTYQVFASGWGQATQGAKLVGRATEVTFAPDGRLFVGDDISGRIFWIAPRTLVRPQ